MRGTSITTSTAKDAIIAAIVERDVEQAEQKIVRNQDERDLLAYMLNEVELCGRAGDMAARALRLEVMAESSRKAELGERLGRADDVILGSLCGLVERLVTELDAADCKARAEVPMAVYEGLNLRSLRRRRIDGAAMRAALLRTLSCLLRP